MADKLRDGNSPENVGSRRRLPAVSAGGRGGGRGGCCGSYWFLLTSGTLLTLVLLAAIAIYLWCEVEWERNAAAVLAAPSGPATSPGPTYFPAPSRLAGQEAVTQPAPSDCPTALFVTIFILSTCGILFVLCTVAVCHAIGL